MSTGTIRYPATDFSALPVTCRVGCTVVQAVCDFLHLIGITDELHHALYAVDECQMTSTADTVRQYTVRHLRAKPWGSALMGIRCVVRHRRGKLHTVGVLVHLSAVE